MGGDVVCLDEKVIFWCLPHKFCVNLTIGVETVHALLPAKGPGGGEMSHDRVGERCDKLVLQILQGIERLVYLPVRLMLLMDVGIAKGQEDRGVG